MGRRYIRGAALIAAAILIGMQMIPVDRSNPPVQSEIQAPDSVMTILKRACYDCHSNQTNWPWYSYLAPASWFVVRHVNHGRGDLNFSEWPAFDFEAQELTMSDIHEQIEHEEMPLSSYLLLHPGARLTGDDRRILLHWAAR
jgi:hypothetical protein